MNGGLSRLRRWLTGAGPNGGPPEPPSEGNAESGWRAPAERLLARASGQRVRSYSTHDFGRERDDRCLSVVLPERRASALLPVIRPELPPGAVAFIGTTKWLGEERHGGVELVVGPGESQLDVLRLARTDAVNYDMDTEDIVAKLREYDDEYGIMITHAETDTVEFTLAREPDDLSAFAADLYTFCPDMVDQGIGSVEALAEAIEITGAVYLWWD